MSFASGRSALRRGAALRQFGQCCFVLSLVVASSTSAGAEERKSDWFALPSLVDPSVLNDGDTNLASTPSVNFRRVSLSEVLTIDDTTALDAAPSDEVVSPVAELHQVRIVEDAPAHAARSIPKNTFRSTLKTQTPEPADFQGVRPTPAVKLPHDPAVSQMGDDLPPFTPVSDGMTLRDHLNQMAIVAPAPATLLLALAGIFVIRPLRRFVSHRSGRHC